MGAGISRPFLFPVDSRAERAVESSSFAPFAPAVVALEKV